MIGLAGELGVAVQAYSRLVDRVYPFIPKVALVRGRAAKGEFPRDGPPGSTGPLALGVGRALPLGEGKRCLFAYSVALCPNVGGTMYVSVSVLSDSEAGPRGSDPISTEIFRCSSGPPVLRSRRRGRKMGVLVVASSASGGVPVIGDHAVQHCLQALQHWNNLMIGPQQQYPNRQLRNRTPTPEAAIAADASGLTIKCPKSQSELGLADPFSLALMEAAISANRPTSTS